MTVNNAVLLVPLLFNNKENLFSILFPLLSYFLPFMLIMNALACLSKKYEKIGNLYQLKNPILILSFLVTGVAFSGIPVLGGFIVKYLIFTQVLSFQAIGLLLLIIFATLIPIYYYMRLIQAMFLSSKLLPEFTYLVSWQEVSILNAVVFCILLLINILLVLFQILPSYLLILV